MLAACLAVSMIAARSQPADLAGFVRSRDASYSWKVDPSDSRRLRMTSQSWQGTTWQHDLVFLPYEPKRTRSAAILYLTGDGPDPKEIAEAMRLAEAADMQVVMLYGLPNQPLFDKTEDDLLAYSFERYLQSGDPSWPALMPMTRAVIRAMDTLEAYGASRRQPLRRFVLTGISKRGWTTWLAGATGDSRIAGIAPMAYDNLNIPAQLQHQMREWGQVSEMFAPYTQRGLTALVDSEPGQKLLGLIDPFAYRTQLKTPTLVVNGTNDRFWATDALGLYWGQMRMPRSVCTVPNEGHRLGDRTVAYDAVGAFARACIDGWAFPSPVLALRQTESGWWADVRTSGRVAERLSLWTAHGTSGDLREAKWTPLEGEAPLRGVSHAGYRIWPAKGWTAVMGIADYRIAGVQFQLSTPIKIIRR